MLGSFYNLTLCEEGPRGSESGVRDLIEGNARASIRVQGGYRKFALGKWEVP
jgi:hypothetical protein